MGHAKKDDGRSDLSAAYKLPETSQRQVILKEKWKTCKLDRMVTKTSLQLGNRLLQSFTCQIPQASAGTCTDLSTPRRYRYETGTLETSPFPAPHSWAETAPDEGVTPGPMQTQKPLRHNAEAKPLLGLSLTERRRWAGEQNPSRPPPSQVPGAGNCRTSKWRRQSPRLPAGGSESDGSAGDGKMAAPSLLRGGLRRLFTGLFGNAWASPPVRALREGESEGGPGRRGAPAGCPVASPRSGDTVAFAVFHPLPKKYCLI